MNYEDVDELREDMVCADAINAERQSFCIEMFQMSERINTPAL